MSVKILTAKEAVQLVTSDSVLCNEGFVGDAIAEELLLELQTRYRETGQPKDLTLFFCAGQGDSGERGINHMGEEGLLKCAIGGHWNMAPRVQKLAMENKMEAYNMPQGVLAQMYRDVAAGRPTISRIGLRTFVDPRLDGGKVNDITTKDRVHLVKFGDQEYLHYDGVKFDFAFIRGTYADEMGNISMEKECCTLGGIAVASAVKNCGGTVIVQVEKVVKHGELDARNVKIPGILVDVVVPVSDMKYHMQTFGTQYDGAMSGESRVDIESPEKLPMSIRKVITRRCAMELSKDAVVNLGIGMPELVSTVANEEGVADTMTLTIESGPVGGVPQSGLDFGASKNPEAILEQATIFDFYDGGGLDEAFLGLAECDQHGNINVSKFGPRLAGCGGFINITQSAKKVIFCGTFTAKGLEVEIKDGKINILQEGAIKKFVNQVQHVTFSGDLARETKQKVIYVTERVVLEMTAEGIMITEIAPGVDLQKDVLDQMEFPCKVSEDLKLMDERIFQEELMGLTIQS